MILLGFAVVILLGALLLVLPVASKTGGGTSFLDALFTSASAVCVTGLVVFDTATKWTLFGQIVILVLIQIGGIGVVTLATSFVVLSGKKIGIYGRETVKNALSAPSVGGVIRLTAFVVKGCFIIELIGVLALLPVFCRDYGAEGIWLAIFHSVSAFCNAGFDLMGDKTGEFSSFTGYAAQPVVNATLILLIVVGGIGFLVWEDVCRNKWRVNRYRTQSKVVLITSAILLVFPALYFFFFEFGGLPFGERLAVSVFQAVTPRTAGFNTADVAGFGDAGRGVLTVLMLVGGSPGSTAGGMKTTTLAVLFASAVAVFQKKDNAELMRRRIDDTTVKSAAAILLLYLTIFFCGGTVISAVEGLPIGACLFEAASAVGTVGLTTGITPTLGAVSKLILIGSMYFGRVGGLTLIYAAFGGAKKPLSKLPSDTVAVG
ncbi:MAG: Trk family potassium uptake protein [Clostridia bacterium]|nr:Trk family potassium uptake protein [Clostridia bacterium]